MTTLFKKLNFKNQKTVLLVQPPNTFAEEIKAMEPYTRFETGIAEGTKQKFGFAMAFVTTQKEIDSLTPPLVACLEDDGVLWFCYPKGSSKNLRCDFNRDTGWAILGQFQMEPVRSVSIDLDWTALRFRQVSKIQKITRRESYALTSEGKERTSQKGK